MRRNKVIGLLLIIIGIMIPVTKYILNIKNKYQEEEKIITFLESTSGTKKDISTQEIPLVNNSYIAILEIPRINLKRGLLDISDKYNDISYNIAIMETSKMPDVIDSNLILASHNGTSDVSFFKDLEALIKEDIVNVYYNGYKYEYKIDNYYEVEKTGKVNIHRDKTKNTITLITCKNNTDDKQIVYIGYLTGKEAY